MDAHQRLAVLPLGATEQHGPHLPTTTDTVIANALAAGVVACVDLRWPGDVVMLPAMPFGASGEHAGFDGLVSIGHEALVQVLLEVGRSVGEWCTHLVIINGHGGNMFSLIQAVPQLRAEGHDVTWYGCTSGLDNTDNHAGKGETSLMLYLEPDLVDMVRAEPGCTDPLPEIFPRMFESGVKSVSPNGVLGDPGDASPQAGEKLHRADVRNAMNSILQWCPDEFGRLIDPPRKK